MAALTTVAGVFGALALFWVERNTQVRFLFDRPAALHLGPPKRVALQAAE